MQYWFEYVKASYDLVMESEQIKNVFLEHEVEAYVVHLFARNFHNREFAQNAVCMDLMNAMNTRNITAMQQVADNCLLINSMPCKKRRWPSPTYYEDLGTMAYAMCNNPLMERNFKPASVILNAIFERI